jgi:hypothetical protein
MVMLFLQVQTATIGAVRLTGFIHAILLLVAVLLIWLMTIKLVGQQCVALRIKNSFKIKIIKKINIS